MPYAFHLLAGLLLGRVLIGAEPPRDNCQDLPACCVSPRPSTVHGSATQSAVLPSEAVSEDFCHPRAHCIAPRAQRVLKLTSCVSPQEVSLAELLRNWEAASQQRPQRSPREQEWWRQNLPDGLSAHARDLVLQLAGAVSAARLERDFRWEITGTTESTIELAARPRDEAVELFCRELRITLDRNRYLPEEVQVVPRGRGTYQARVGTSLVTVAYELEAELTLDDMPPSPLTPFRVATGTAAEPRTQR